MKKNFLKNKKYFYFCSGEMAEWSIAAVLKTVEVQASGGSNPSLSARMDVIRHQKTANPFRFHNLKGFLFYQVTSNNTLNCIL
jgi:hypothetical protein